MVPAVVFYSITSCHASCPYSQAGVHGSTFMATNNIEGSNQYY